MLRAKWFRIRDEPRQWRAGCAYQGGNCRGRSLAIAARYFKTVNGEQFGVQYYWMPRGFEHDDKTKCWQLADRYRKQWELAQTAGGADYAHWRPRSAKPRPHQSPQWAATPAIRRRNRSREVMDAPAAPIEPSMFPIRVRCPVCQWINEIGWNEEPW